MLNIVHDGILSLYTYKEALLFFSITVLGLGVFFLKHTMVITTEGISLTAAIGIGSVILCLLSFGLVILSHFLPFLLQPGSYAIFSFGFFALIRSLYLGKIKVSNYLEVIGGLAIFLLLCIRLAFLKYVILPPYSDSPIHYQIVLGFLHPEAALNTKISIDSIFTNYYHFGFHSITAWLVSVTNLAPADAILVVGQLFLIIGPLSISFLIKILTKSTPGAWLAGLLAAIGWHMPAFAVNWGKYPALSSLATLPAILAFWWLYSQGYIHKNKGLILGIILTVGIALLHTRMILGILLFIACFYITDKLSFDDELGYFKSISYSVLYMVILWQFVAILKDFYNGFIVLFLMIVLLPFAFQGFPRLAAQIFLFTFGLWFLTTAPTLLNKNLPPLFDRQFIAMLLYIPLSIMGGLGLAGLLKKAYFKEILRGAVVTVLCSAVIINFWQNDSVYPNPCCNYFQASDQFAFDWLQKHISKHDLVLISAFNNGGQLVETDAGMWLTPLLDLPTNKLPFDIRWDSQSEINKLCSFSTSNAFIYMGGRTDSFDNAQLIQAKWTRLVYKSGKTMIYEISNCQ